MVDNVLEAEAQIEHYLIAFRGQLVAISETNLTLRKGYDLNYKCKHQNIKTYLLGKFIDLLEKVGGIRHRYWMHSERIRVDTRYERMFSSSKEELLVSSFSTSKSIRLLCFPLNIVPLPQHSTKPKATTAKSEERTTKYDERERRTKIVIVSFFFFEFLLSLRLLVVVVVVEK